MEQPRLIVAEQHGVRPVTKQRVEITPLELLPEAWRVVKPCNGSSFCEPIQNARGIDANGDVERREFLLMRKGQPPDPILDRSLLDAVQRINFMPAGGKDLGKLNYRTLGAADTSLSKRSARIARVIWLS